MMGNEARGVVFSPLVNKAAIEYIKAKIPAASAHWDDWIAPVHAKSFTVAGAPSVEFAADMHEAVSNVIANGGTISDFRKDFDRIVEQYGWTYKGKRGWRTRVIFDTNMRTAKMAAKWAQIQANKDVAPYLEYVSVLDGRTTKNCNTWDGLVLHVDDVFWDTYYPPNHWGCRATVRQYSASTLARHNKTVAASPTIDRQDVINKRTGEVYHNVPKGIAPGWDHNVGQAWIAPEVALGKKLATMPPLLAGEAYQNMVTEPFIKAVNRSWEGFITRLRETGRKQNKIHFVGFLNPTIQTELVNHFDEIIDATKAYNLSVNERRQVNLPSTLVPKNYAIVAPDFKSDHYIGGHRTVNNPHDWPDEWIFNLPSLIHSAEYVFYDVSGQTIGYLTDKKILVKDRWRYGVVYVRLDQAKKTPISNWLVSLNTKHLEDLKQNTISLKGSIPNDKNQP